LNLSSFLVTSLVAGLKLDIPVNCKLDLKSDKPEVMGVELTISGRDIDPTLVYGEIVISDFLVGLSKNKKLTRFG